MVDEVYKNAFKEVHDILENTDEELLKKIPTQFKEFIYENMNKEYITNINKDVEIDKQSILKESEAILALIYRSYWATNEEKIAFAHKDKEERIKEENEKRESLEDIKEIFEKRKNTHEVTLNNKLMIIKKESFIKQLFKKISTFFRW